MKALFLVLGLALALVSAAQAGAPTQTTVDWSSTRVIPASTAFCPFPIQVHSFGVIHDWVYEDGTHKRIFQGFHIEWTNLTTGEVAATPFGGPGIEYPDGTVVIDGLNGRFIGQGEGIAYGDIGRTVTTLEGLVFSAGQHSDALFPNVCEALN